MHSDLCLQLFFFFGSFFSELGTEPRALRFLGKRSTTELSPQPLFTTFIKLKKNMNIPNNKICYHVLSSYPVPSTLSLVVFVSGKKMRLYLGDFMTVTWLMGSGAQEKAGEVAQQLRALVLPEFKVQYPAPTWSSPQASITPAPEGLPASTYLTCTHMHTGKCTNKAV